VYTKDAIRFSLDMAEDAVLRSLSTIDDAPLTFPTAKGGCHPLWVLGHLAFVEGLAYEILAGKENPAREWADLFGQDSTATDNLAQYPPLADVVARYMKLRRKNLQLLDSLSEIDLDKRTSWQPKGVEEHFATYGKSLLTLALHQMAHRGQITDAIRSAGRTVAAPVGAEV
jgi:uncharacterized damage-inducible protein DinB